MNDLIPGELARGEVCFLVNGDGKDELIAKLAVVLAAGGIWNGKQLEKTNVYSHSSCGNRVLEEYIEVYENAFGGFVETCENRELMWMNDFTTDTISDIIDASGIEHGLIIVNAPRLISPMFAGNIKSMAETFGWGALVNGWEYPETAYKYCDKYVEFTHNGIIEVLR